MWILKWKICLILIEEHHLPFLNADGFTHQHQPAAIPLVSEPLTQQVFGNFPHNVGGEAGSWQGRPKPHWLADCAAESVYTEQSALTYRNTSKTKLFGGSDRNKPGLP